MIGCSVVGDDCPEEEDTTDWMGVVMDVIVGDCQLAKLVTG